MSASDTQERKSKAEQFTIENIAACAQDLIDWKETSVLGKGKFRELSRLCDFAGTHAMQLAESLVTREALRIAAGKSREYYADYFEFSNVEAARFAKEKAESFGAECELSGGNLFFFNKASYEYFHYHYVLKMDPTSVKKQIRLLAC